MPPAAPIDPLSGPKMALAGRIVCMDASFTVIPRGVAYIDQGRLVAVLDATAPPPADFAAQKVLDTGGTLYPGLIELHNHLSYNALRLWRVPKLYTNRDQWSGTPEYQKLISGPMKVLGKAPGLLPAVVRYVECKCLLGGVTTSQGVELYSNTGARRYYRGIVRNVEQTDDADLPEAKTKIADVEAKKAELFLERLKRQSCFLLHLSEGTDAKARSHFEALHLADGRWAITDALAGIHCAALEPEDFGVLAQLGGAAVWSPLSNLLLYGKTANVKAARKEGVRLGLGSDWSPSGSKNLLGELKVARLVSEELDDLFTDRDLVSLATRNAAAILKWDKVLGSLEAGKRADLLVIDGKTGDPYAALIKAKETAIRLVLINGVPRYGLPGLMKKLGADGENVRVGGKSRMVLLDQETQDPAVLPLSLAAARTTLTDALHNLPQLAKDLEKTPTRALSPFTTGPQPVVWSLALDELEDTGMDLRPRLPLPGEEEPTGPTRAAAAAPVPLSSLLEALTLDPLTVADDKDFLTRIDEQKNLPKYVKDGLRKLYE